MKLLENDIRIKCDLSNYPCLLYYRYNNNNLATAIRQCKTWYVTNVCKVVYTFLKCTCGLATTFLFIVFKLWMYMLLSSYALIAC